MLLVVMFILILNYILQLSALGASWSVLSVSLETALQFVFRGSEFFSSESVSRASVCIGSGACVQLSQQGDAGVQELWR